MIVDKEILRRLEGLAPCNGDIDVVPTAYKKRLEGVENWEQYAPVVVMTPLKVADEPQYRKALTGEDGQIEKMREIVSEHISEISRLIASDGSQKEDATADDLSTEVIAELFLELGYRGGVMPRPSADDA